MELIRKRANEGLNIEARFNAIARNKETGESDPEFCLDFHLNLVQLADNDKLLNLYLSLSNNIRRYQMISYTLGHASCLKEHLEILAPLLGGDYERAKSAIKSHLTELRDKILQQTELAD